jgi:hypothetical protein
MEILQQPDSLCFSSALKDIIVQVDENIDVSFCIQGQEPFLTETYSPDAEGKICIRELGRLFAPYISKVNLRETFIIQIASYTITTTVLYGLCEINAGAADFLASSFLTLLPFEKITLPEQKEYLSLVVTEATEATIYARRRSGETESKTLNINMLNQAVTLDVSPSIFADPETIIYYTVTAGDRAFTYYLRRPSAQNPPQFLFLNSFGVKETFIPSGLLLRENKYENKTGIFNGRFLKYNIDLVKEYSADTGILNESTADWVEEIFSSRDVYILSPDGEKKEITITEATVKRSSARDALPAYEFKYRPSKANHQEYTADRNRIFDDTHNFTFN